MDIHKEINFEAEICEHLAANGWLYAEEDAADYDYQLAFFPVDVLQDVEAAHFTGDPRRKVRSVELRDRSDAALAGQ